MNRTPDLLITNATVAANTGGTPQGLDFRLKGEGSLERKLNMGADPADLGDTLRYTITYEPGQLAKGANSTLDQLKQQGYEVIKVKNTFAQGEPYQGINTTLRSPEGQLMELQFHTPQSFDVKQNLTHDLYEQQRVNAETMWRWRQYPNK